MAQVILDCEVVGGDDGWTLTAGANKVEAVRRPDDDTTSMLSTSTINTKQSFYLDAMPGGVAFISQVDTFSRTRENGADSAIAARRYLRLGGSTTNGTPTSPNGTTWLNDTETAWARPGGGAWTVADFPGGSSGTELGIEETTDSANSIQVTTLYATVTYTPAVGGFAYLMGCWLPPLLAVASHGLSASDLARFLRAFKVRPTADYELDLVRGLYLVRPRFAF